MKNTVASLLKMKQNGEKISMLTCYDYSTAKLMEASEINMILVGIPWEIPCWDTRIRCR